MLVLVSERRIFIAAPFLQPSLISSPIVGEPRHLTGPAAVCHARREPPAFMEPLTHFLTGACIGRAGFNRKTAFATFAAVLGRRGCGSRYPLVVRRPGRGIEASSRHHPYVSRRAFVAAAAVGPSGSSIAGARRGAGARPAFHALSSHPLLQNQLRPRRRRSIGAGSTPPHSSPRSATSCSTGPTTTASVPFSPSIPAGTPAASFSSLSRYFGDCFFSPSSCLGSSASPTAKSASAATLFAARAGLFSR